MLIFILLIIKINNKTFCIIFIKIIIKVSVYIYLEVKAKVHIFRECTYSLHSVHIYLTFWNIYTFTGVQKCTYTVTYLYKYIYIQLVVRNCFNNHLQQEQKNIFVLVIFIIQWGKLEAILIPSFRGYIALRSDLNLMINMLQL